MNLSPAWVETLQAAGFEAIHWSKVGAPNAPDTEVFAYAYQHGYIVFTHDLDFGAILAATGHTQPSVIQVRTQNVTPDYLAKIILSVLQQFEDVLMHGALITIDEERSRVRILPLAGRFGV